MVAVALSATPRSSSTLTSPRSPLADTAVFPTYVHFYLLRIVIGSCLLYSQAHEHHRAYLKSLPATSYPLEPTNDAADVNEAQRVTEGGLEQR